MVEVPVLEAQTRREGVQFLAGVGEQVRPLVATPRDAEVIDVHGHNHSPPSRTRPAGSWPATPPAEVTFR